MSNQDKDRFKTIFHKQSSLAAVFALKLHLTPLSPRVSVLHRFYLASSRRIKHLYCSIDFLLFFLLFFKSWCTFLLMHDLFKNLITYFIHCSVRKMRRSYVNISKVPLRVKKLPTILCRFFLRRCVLTSRFFLLWKKLSFFPIIKNFFLL